MTKYVESPLNYTGGKYKLLPQLLPLLPRGIVTAVDLFCGGCNVGINLECRNVVFNDSNTRLMEMFRTLTAEPGERTIGRILEITARYGLSDTAARGYGAYGCDSDKGLGSYNREAYTRLRDDFNRAARNDTDYYIMMYVLIVYAFNNQIRFNARGDFNLPVGKRDFNARMRLKLCRFIETIRGGNYRFVSEDFRDVDPAEYGPEPFVYADPPYLIGRASYNERGGWGEEDERGLLEYLDSLHARGIRFALSNVLSNKGRTNEILREWSERNARRYRTHHLDFDYSNSNYHGTAVEMKSDEVLIVNY